ncbi:hypothetical protein C8F04DRAFT_137444 [Mycena alexandri]|uniref:Uncharacterized protein n=1 Tax=Mycena alexandri TaxID=1745969 RepID=A0AAD6WSD5_9AGAR|nr:hypothetical protein C8F04DRAFT_137444 [Mycena alexandri]
MRRLVARSLSNLALTLSRTQPMDDTEEAKLTSLCHDSQDDPTFARELQARMLPSLVTHVCFSPNSLLRWKYVAIRGRATIRNRCFGRRKVTELLSISRPPLPILVCCLSTTN